LSGVTGDPQQARVRLRKPVGTTIEDPALLV
jgi:hypothetical protein